MTSNEIIPLRGLIEKKYRLILCYPRFTHTEFENRIEELQKLGVEKIEFNGDQSIFDIPILGKGCVGIVVISYTNDSKFAMKIRRVDSDRMEMFHEGEMMKIANSVNVGPKFGKTSKNFLLMDLIEGKYFPEWTKSLEEKDRKLLRQIIRNILDQCYRLDLVGLDHGELSSAPKHIIIDKKNVPYLIDFETASNKRRVSNVSSICQFFFLGSQIAPIVKEKMGKEINEKKLVETLRIYKQSLTRYDFEKIIDQIF